MLQRFDHRGGHYLLLVAVWAACCLTNLGAPTLWDIDEGLNAGAAREMLDSGNLVVPTFNYELRSAKPALLYWLQVGAYHYLGVNEFAARLPSALAALLCVLAVYEFGRFAFCRATGLLGGLVLGTSVSFLGSAHFANPDALLVAFFTLSLALFFHDWQTGRRGWLGTSYVALGLAVLAKGPVGLALPAMIVIFFLLWQRRLGHLLDLRLVTAVLLFLLVVLPWYVFVSLETRGVFLREFLLKENITRALAPMESHSGPWWYYLMVLPVGLVPWTIFLWPVVAYSWEHLRGETTDARERAVLQFLVVWFGVTLAVFSVAQTKLPNYVLPLYPAAALLTARTLVRWQRGEWAVPAWVMRGSMISLALIGAGVSAGILLVSGVPDVAALRPHAIPALYPWAWAGLLLVAGAAAGWPLLVRGRRAGVIACVTASGALFVAVVAGGALAEVNSLKPASDLAEMLPADHEYREVRLGAYRWFQPSLVFYCRREITRLHGEGFVHEFLHDPVPGYLFLPEREWEAIRRRLPPDTRVLGKRRDLYTRQNVVVVTRERNLVAER